MAEPFLNSRSDIPGDRHTHRPSPFIAYLQMIQRYALLILLTSIMGVGLALWLLLNVVKPVYQASTSLLVVEQRGGGLSGMLTQIEDELEALGPLRNLAMQGSSQSSTEDLISILRSRSLAEKVAATLPLRMLQEVQLMLDDAPAGTEDRLLVEYLQKQTKILPPDSQDGTLRVRVRLSQPDLSARAANLYVNELKAYVGVLINKEQGKQLDYLDEQLHKLERELAEAEGGLLRFQQRNRTIALDEEVKQLIAQIAELEADELTAQAALKDAQARARKLDQSAIELSPEAPAARNAIELDVAGLQERQRTLTRARQRYQKLLSGLPAQALELARIERQVMLKSRLYLLLQQQSQATRLEAARSVELFRVLDPAQPPLAPVYPVRGLWLATSAILSLAVGIILASILDFLRSLRRPQASGPEGILQPEQVTAPPEQTLTD